MDEKMTQAKCAWRLVISTLVPIWDFKLDYYYIVTESSQSKISKSPECNSEKKKEKKKAQILGLERQDIQLALT